MECRTSPHEKPRFCPHPVHTERSERMRLRSTKGQTRHFCDACETQGRVRALAFGSDGLWGRWW